MNEGHLFCVKVLAVAFMGSLCSLPFWRAVCRGSGLVDVPGHRKIHGVPMPLAGGLAVFTGIIFAIGWMIFAAGKMGQPPVDVMNRLAGLVGGSVLMMLLGLVDDRFELRAGVKFCGQMLIASAACATGLRLNVFLPGIDQVASVFWMLAVTNAFNFIDNMNGLSAGLACVGSFAMGVVLEMKGGGGEALLCFGVAGATVGFLPFNYPRASAFLGDSGSHLLGFFMAAMPLNAVMFGSTGAVKAVPLLFFFVPLLDLAQVVAWRCWRRRPVWVGDRNHLSHRLVSVGLQPAIAVALLWLMAAIAASVGVWLCRRQ